MKFNEDYKKRLDEAFGASGKKINGMKAKNWLKENPDIEKYLNEILEKEPRFTTIGNVIWAMRNDFDIDLYVCKTCGAPLKMIHATQLGHFCSVKCAMSNNEMIEKRQRTIANDPEYYEKRQEKIRSTNLERYGVDIPAKSQKVKEKIKETFAKTPGIWARRYEKTKQTCLAHYNVENPSQVAEIKEKKKQTCLAHYGVDVPAKSNNIKERCKKTCLERYGVDNALKRKDIIDKSIDKSWKTIQSWSEYIVPNFTREEYTGCSHGQEYEWKCIKCGSIFKQRIYHTKHLDLNQCIPRCEKCYPKEYTSSVREKELLEFIRQYFPTAGKDRKIIAPFELDIVIPEIHLAIEFNGDYWHSDKYHPDKNYHLMKTNLCNAAGYRLLHIFEFEWKYKKEIIKEKLKTIFGFCADKVYARKCIVKPIDAKTKNDFLNKTHIQGEDKSKVKLGLFSEDELVAVMTFGKPRFNKNYEWELIRYSSSKHAIGGAGKLLKHFIDQYKPSSIITYADKRWSNGNMYKKIGFTKLKDTAPGYFYVKGDLIYSRIQCQKAKLKNILGDKVDPTISETENMISNGFLKIYDCGNYSFEMNFK